MMRSMENVAQIVGGKTYERESITDGREMPIAIESDGNSWNVGV